MPKAKPKRVLQAAPSSLGHWPATASIVQLAELVGISPRAMRDRQAKGELVPAPQKGQFLTIPSLHNYLTSLRQSAQGRATTDGGLSLADERAKSEQVNRQIAELKLAQIRGEVLTLDEVATAWAALAMQLRASVLALPGKARSTIPHLTPHDGEKLRLLCREALGLLAEEVEVGVVGADPEELASKEVENV